MFLKRSVLLLMMGSSLITSCSTAHRQTREHGHDAPLLPGMSAKIDPNEAPLPNSPPISDRSNQPIPAQDVSGEMLVIDNQD